MSIEEVDAAIAEWQLNDELAQARGFCRRSAVAMMGIARRADRTAPRTRLRYVAWPKASKDEATHYALTATVGRTTHIYNPVHTGSFPRYSGDARNAPGYLRKMRPVRQVV